MVSIYLITMKTILIASVLIILSIGLRAQTTLTYANNALTIGDSYNFQEIQFPDPGSAGPNQIWDFSKIQFTGKSPVGTMQSPAIPKMDGIADYNLSLLENGYDYFLNSSETRLEELGYVNNDLKITLKYSDPVIKMQYPFSYGGQFTDHFIGIANASEINKIDFFGDNTVSADGFGTLILPDRIIENSLRVKSVKTGLQVNMCGTADVNIVKYNWYAAGYRYPVLSLTITENRPSIGAVQIIKTAFTNTQQPNKNITISGNKTVASTTVPSSQNLKPEVSVSISPNPFTDKLNYSYFLNEPLKVSIELYSMGGKNISWLVKDQVQPVGMQTGELVAAMYNLTSGVYFIRFTFDKQVVIQKVVKI